MEIYSSQHQKKNVLSENYFLKIASFLSSLLFLSQTDFNSHEFSVSQKTNTITLFLHIYWISAALRDEVLGKTTVDEQCQKFVLHKIH